MKIISRNTGDLLEVSWGNNQWVKLLEAYGLSPEIGQMLCRWVGQQWQRMPNGQESQCILPAQLQQPDGEHITFYAGTFNPWHRGHLECVNLVAARPLVVVPDISPWKEANRFTETSAWDEVLLILKQLPKSVHIYPGFWGQAISNPTSQWLPACQWQKKSLVMGSDSFEKFTQWKDYRRLVSELAGIFVVPRKVDEASYELVLKDILALNPDIKISRLSPHDYEEVSSSKLRQQ